MGIDDEELRWKIGSVRESIGLDWAILASKDLPAEKRKLVREHLKMCTSSLTALKRQFELKQWTSGNSNLESRQSDLFLHHNSQASSQD